MKVFLSSTHDDLVEHRKAAHDALEQLGLQVVWMEAFGARPIESLKACLDDIEECELFVGIYAYRYGSISEGKSISITEEEFNHAQKLGKPIFGFIVKDDFPWLPKNIEHEKKEKLASLLKKVKKQPVDFFTTPDNLASSITSSIGRYLLTELQKKAQGEGKILFDKLKTYVDSTTKKRIEGDFSSFLVNLKQAILLAKKHGVESFAELVEFSLIRASLLTQTRSLPADYYIVRAILDGIEKTKESVENIGDPGHRALAFAALASSDLVPIGQREEFALKAIELTRHSGAQWEQSSNQSQIGCLLIASMPTIGVEAFKSAIDTIKKAKIASYIEPEIFQTPVDEFEKAYSRNSDALNEILKEFVSFVGDNGGYTLLLNLAKSLYADNRPLALEILEKSYLELTSNSPKVKILDYRRKEYERQIQSSREHLIEVSLLLSENHFAENLIQTTKFEFDLKKFLDAVSSIRNGDFAQAISTCSSSAIRQEVIIRLFELDRPKEAIEYLKHKDFEIANNYVSSILKHNLADELLKKVTDQINGDDFIGFFYKRALIGLKISLAKEWYSLDQSKSQVLLNELVEKDETKPYKFPYWGEAALIIESGIKWGQQKVDQLMEFCVDNIQEQIKEVEQLSKRYDYIDEQLDDEQLDAEMKIGDIENRLKELGAMMSLQSNNFVVAWSSYEEYREQLVKRLDPNKKTYPEIIIGRNHIVNEDWDSFEQWISSIDFSKISWSLSSELVDIVRDLVFKNKLDFAKKLSAGLERGAKWQADSWISVFPMLTELSPYDFEGFDEPDHIFLIRAEVVSKHSRSLAAAYVNLYCEYIIKEKWLDDTLGWDLCNLALFLYKQNDKANAYKYFVLGIQHWFQYAMETGETWNEIVEKLSEVDFEFQFSLAQEVLVWNSTRNIRDVARTLQMFSMFFVNNFEYKHVVDILKAIKRSRDWHLDDEVV